jgi:RNA polymerase sigma-70 factor, ECF subfamily
VRLWRKQEGAPNQAASDASELARRARAGDRAALEALLQTHHEFIRKAIYCQLGPTADFDDLVQSVLARVVGSIASFRGDSAPATWMHGICVHVVRDHLRRKVTSKNAEDRLVRERAAGRAGAEAGADDLLAARRALDNLSINHRTVMVLRLVHGYSVDEIATITSSAKSTTRLRLYYARRAFAKALREER